MKFQSTKYFSGFTTVFRQWKAQNTHCKYLHGYAVSFRLTFEGELDDRNWVWDFGGMKRANGEIDGMTPKEWMDYTFDHTTIVAKDDPEIASFIDLANRGIIQLRVLSDVGAECFARYIYEKLNPFIINETNKRVEIVKVEFFENDKNSGVYII